MLGYFVAMAGVDEMHLLNITVAPLAGPRPGSALLDAVVAHGRDRGLATLWLEVRASNAARTRAVRAARLRRGRRAPRLLPGRRPKREDAVVMSLALRGGGAACPGLNARWRCCATWGCACGTAAGRRQLHRRRPTPPPVAAAVRRGAPSAAVRRRAAPRRVAVAPRWRVAALDWPALREAVAGCRACSLCESRTQTVFGVGHPQAHWMVVGEAPGEQEDLQGEPFVGAAGPAARPHAAALGLTRADDGRSRRAQRVYIANTLKCRPPRNRNPDARGNGAVRALPGAPDRAACSRGMILAMGRFAVQACCAATSPSAGCAAACTATRACR